jgi:hypothetical protein
VHVFEEMMRVDVVALHQPCQRRPVRVEMILLHAVRFCRVAFEQALDVRGHALVDQGEEAARMRIEAIVEVEDPVADVGEFGSYACGHCRAALANAGRPA